MAKTFLALDFMVGIADQDYARGALDKAVIAVDAARHKAIPVVFSKIGFRQGHPEVSRRNKTFAPLIGTDKLVGEQSRLIDRLTPRVDEPVVDKKRFSAFAGNDLWMMLRVRGLTEIVMCGLSTGGVVLSTALALIDADYDVTILADACADPDAKVHDAVLHGILGARASIRTVEDWRAA